MSIIPNTYIPEDVWRHIGSFLSLKNLAPLFRSCRTLNAMSGSIFDILARIEQSRMQIPFQGVRLTLDCLVKQWRQLDLESSRKLA